MSEFVPKRKSLVDAVREVLGRFTDKSQAWVKLKGMPKKGGFVGGNPMRIPFQKGATENCYYLELEFCEENDEHAVQVTNLYATDEMIEGWADELWELWSKSEEE